MTLRRSITNELRNEAALSSTFSRGQDLHRARLVEVQDVSREAGFADVRALVRGSGLSPYTVSLVVDERENTLVEYSCTCPSHAKYEGMCKHAVAAGLAYLDLATGVEESWSILDRIWPWRRERASKQAARPAIPVASAIPQEPAQPPEPPKPKPVRTSQAISNLLAGYANAAQQEARRANVIAPVEEVPAEPVDLQCVISSGKNVHHYSWSPSDTWSLGLKVVRGKVSYVVKHIDELVDAWHAGRSVSYGKNLEFVHQPEAFTDRANALLSLLSDVLEAHQSLYAAQENRFYGNETRLSTKTLPLSPRQMAQVLDVMMDQKVVVETIVSGGRGSANTIKRTIPVEDGNPRLEVAIAPVGVKVAGTGGKELGVPAGQARSSAAPLEAGDLADATGFRLSVYPDEFECIRGANALYLVGRSAVHRCTAEFTEKLGPFCEALFPGQQVLDIALDDMPGFCASVLEPLREFTQFVEPAALELNELLPPTAEFQFRVGLADGFITCDARVLYGEAELPLFEPVRSGQPARDVEREMAAQQAVFAYFPNHDMVRLPDYSRVPRANANAYGGWGGRDAATPQVYAPVGEPDFPWFSETDDAAYYQLFSEGLRELADLGEVMLSERLRNVNVRQAPEVRVEASVKSGLLDIAVESSDMTPAELVAYLASFRRKQKFVRLGNGDIVRLDGSIGAVADLADGLGLDAESLVKGVDDLPANRTLFVDAMMKRASGVRFERDAGFRSIVRDFETVADADYTAPGAFRELLRPYQVEGFKWLCTLGKAGFGGILADDMGLGKTLQMMAYLALSREEGEPRPALVVCPASLVYNWAAEFAKFAPDTCVAVVAGAKKERLQQIAAACTPLDGGLPGVAQSAADVLVTSYDLMKRDVDAYAQEDFSCVVLDEAQYIKNASTQAAKSAKRLPAGVRFALTGTPIENRLSELWSIFDFLMPGVLGSAESF
ncbi:MAG: SNF2 helicase associated domain-containing protein, partial [Coriobacteriia bacterium]|nr:SNF2 helicase associated domain-containing protein [Coriobacteriia bacterium]